MILATNFIILPMLPPLKSFFNQPAPDAGATPRNYAKHLWRH